MNVEETYDFLDALVDTDPIRLRDEAWKLYKETQNLREALLAVEEIAMTGKICHSDAQVIRAVRPINDETRRRRDT